MSIPVLPLTVYIQKCFKSPDCLLGVVTQPTDSRLSETSNLLERQGGASGLTFQDQVFGCVRTLILCAFVQRRLWKLIYTGRTKEQTTVKITICRH